MANVHLFVEDEGQRLVVGGLMRRIAGEVSVPLTVQEQSVRGGHGRALAVLKGYVRDVRRKRVPYPDAIVVAVDGNCHGHAGRLGAVRDIIGDLTVPVVCAVPTPHIERWLLLDAHAFKAVLGSGCSAPDHKCDRDRYKELLAGAVRAAGLEPVYDGLEHAPDLVEAMDLIAVGRQDTSIRQFLDDARATLVHLRDRPG